MSERSPDDDGVPFRPHPSAVRPRPRHGGSMLMAAMLGLAEALGMDPESTEMIQPADPGRGQDFDLSFGPLPPLE